MNNRGVSTIELLVSFVIIAIVAIGMFSAVFDILDKIDYYQEQLSVTIFRGNVINSLQKDLNQKKLYGLSTCGTYCYDITYQNLTTKRFKVDTTKKTIQYGGIAEALPKGFDFSSGIIFNTATISTPTGRNDSIFRIYIPIGNTSLGINTDINIVYQYDSRTMKNLP
jgi:type II secretory pathway pseudopilin PulG